MAYIGNVPVNSGFYPRNNNNFPIASAEHIYVDPDVNQGNERLAGALAEIFAQLTALAGFNEKMVPIFVGTTAEYNAAADTVVEGTIVFITDDVTTNSSSASAVLGQATLGQMLLGNN